MMVRLLYKFTGYCLVLLVWSLNGASSIPATRLFLNSVGRTVDDDELVRCIVSLLAGDWSGPKECDAATPANGRAR